MILPLLLALSVTASDAICAVRGWTRQGGTLTVIGAPVKADRFETASGNAFYAVATSQGTVFVSADTDYEPILAFTSSVADFSQIDPASPLWALMTSSADNAVYDPDAFARWQELLAAGSLRRMLLGVSQGVDTINSGDIRVEPLTKSTWDQATAGNIKDGNPCYNYYTPGNSVCGCVATAMAQVMYYHKYPAASVAAQTKQCRYNGEATYCTMKGGVYEWAKMMDVPAADASEEVREAIGTLTYDCGVATHMQWTQTFSGTYGCYAETAFCSNFFYCSATYTDRTDLLTSDNIGKALLSNLDAGLPVMMGISGASGGHSIVADGYGFKEDNLYVHLNLGWSGTDNLWYNLPNMNTSQYSFSVINEMIYNIIPGTTVKGVFSGRILNETGQPVANKRVELCGSNGTVLTNATTNAHGVYGFVHTASTNWSKFTVKLAADDTYEAFSQSGQTLTLPTASPIQFTDQNGNALAESTPRTVRNSANLGNSWGNDFTLVAKPVAVSLDNASSTSVAIEPSWFAKYGLVSDVADATSIQSAAVKTAANGINSVAECWVIGISPTNETAQFTAEISFSPDGTVKIEHDPDLKDRTYTTKYSIDLKTWYDWTGETPEGAFFKVEVSK